MSPAIAAPPAAATASSPGREAVDRSTLDSLRDRVSELERKVASWNQQNAAPAPVGAPSTSVSGMTGAELLRCVDDAFGDAPEELRETLSEASRLAAEYRRNYEADAEERARG